MRNTSGDSGHVLPWLLLRQDSHGNRYRVGSYATRAEAQRTAERLAAGATTTATATGKGPTGAAFTFGAGAGDDSYLVESRDHASGTRG